MSRRKYLKQLARSLVFGHVHNRLRIQQTPFDIKQLIHLRFPLEGDEVLPEDAPYEVPLGRCHYCGWRKSRKTRYQCYRCARYICLTDHADYICITCVDRRD